MQKLKKLSLIAIYGPAGAGKTTVADYLHDELVSTAHIGVDHIKRFISEFREVPSHQEVSKCVINAMIEEYLRSKISVIVEQGMSTQEIENLKEIAQRNSASFFVCRLDAHETVLDGRVTERMKRLGKPMIPKEETDLLLKTHKENVYPNTKVFDSGEINTREIADCILKDLL